MPQPTKWQVNYLIFSRAKLTQAAQERLAQLNGQHITIHQIEADMQRWENI